MLTNGIYESSSSLKKLSSFSFLIVFSNFTVKLSYELFFELNWVIFLVLFLVLGLDLLDRGDLDFDFS